MEKLNGPERRGSFQEKKIAHLYCMLWQNDKVLVQIKNLFQNLEFKPKLTLKQYHCRAERAVLLSLKESQWTPFKMSLNSFKNQTSNVVPIMERSVGKTGRGIYLFEKAGADKTGSGLAGGHTVKESRKK